MASEAGIWSAYPMPLLPDGSTDGRYTLATEAGIHAIAWIGRFQGEWIFGSHDERAAWLKIIAHARERREEWIMTTHPCDSADSDYSVRRYTEHLPDDEHSEVTELRARHAATQRQLMRRWVDDPDISDLDLACTLSLITYQHVRHMARVAINLAEVTGNGD